MPGVQVGVLVHRACRTQVLSADFLVTAWLFSPNLWVWDIWQWGTSKVEAEVAPGELTGEGTTQGTVLLSVCDKICSWLWIGHLNKHVLKFVRNLGVFSCDRDCDFSFYPLMLRRTLLTHLLACCGWGFLDVPLGLLEVTTCPLWLCHSSWTSAMAPTLLCCKCRRGVFIWLLSAQLTPKGEKLFLKSEK